MTRLRIALVNQPFDAVLPPRMNSLGLLTYELARRLAAECEVHVFAGRKGWSGARERHGEVDYHFLPTPSRGRGGNWPGLSERRPFFASGLFYADFRWQLGRALARERFDVVHVLNFSQLLPTVRRACPDARVGLHMECSWLDQLDPGLLRPRLAVADAVIGCSDFITDAARECFPAARCRFETVYNGVDADAFRPTSAGAPVDDQRVLFVGRGSPEKGIDTLLDALESLRKRHPEAHLEMIGGVGAAPARYVADISDDPAVRELAPLFGPVYKERIETRAASLGPGAVSIAGPTDHAEVVRAYQESAVFVFPSLWGEPFGIPLVEAMACGLPVVASRGGGIPEIVEDGRTGLLFPRGDAAGLCQALDRLLSDPALRQRMGEAGRRRAEERFGWDRIAGELLGVYTSLGGAR